MIRELKVEELNEANDLLSSFNYKITQESFDNVFLKTLIYLDNGIKAILVYDLLYDRIEIEYIIVNNDCRKRGIGSILLKELEKQNVKNITLEVREGNKNAINFYKRNGYNIETIRKNYYGNEDGYLMMKKLGE